DRGKLIELSEAVKQAGETVVRGGNPNDVLKDLYDESAKAAYAERQIASRKTGSVLQRETNTPGWVRDREAFENYLMNGERYVQIAPARQLLLRARNQIAELAGMAPIQKPG